MHCVHYLWYPSLGQLRQVFLFLVICVFGFMASYPVLAAADALNERSPPSDRAQQGLLLDINHSSGRIFVAGERGHILYSDDQGVNWHQANVPVRVTLTAIEFSTDSDGWAVGHDGVILVTHDAGLSWQKQFDGYQANQLIESELTRLLLLTDDQSDKENTVYQANDLNYLLEDAKIFSEEGASRPFLDVLFLSEQSGFAVGAYGMIFRTEDGGHNWSSWVAHLPNPENYHLNTIVKGKDAVYIAGESGAIFRSLDDGFAWSRLESPYDGPFFGLLVYYNSGHEYLIAYGLRGNAFLSQNQGSSWSRLETGTDGAVLGAATFQESELLLFTSVGELLRFDLFGRATGRIVTKHRSALIGGLYTTRDELLLVGNNGVTEIGLSSSPSGDQ